MFPITTDAQDFGDEEDGPLMTFDDPPLPVDNEV
jgi:hypothetical protein